MAMKGLSPDFIMELQKNSKTKNQYGPLVLEFANSDEAAVNPREVWPELSEKKSAALYQGFNNALKKADLTDAILVKQTGDDVFLLHNERVRAIMAGDNADESTDDADATVTELREAV